MSNKEEKKIKVFDSARFYKGLVISFLICFVATFIIIPMNLSSVFVLIYGLVSLTIIFSYWVHLYKSSYKYVSKNEYREIRKNTTNLFITNELKNQGFSKAEIAKILKDRPVSDYEDLSSTNSDETNNSYDIIEELKDGFVVSNRLLTKAGLGILIDSKAKEIAIIQQDKKIQYINFNQIHSYDVELAEAGSGNGAMAFATLTGNDNLYKLGMANTLAGNKNIYAYIIKLVLNDIDKSDVEINILHKKMLNSSTEFLEIDKVGKKIISSLDKIVSNKSKTTSNSNLDEIKKLKELLDMGAISKEEFEMKKKDLLK